MLRFRLLVSLVLLLAIPPRAPAGSYSPSDNTFREGWSRLSEEKYADAREAFGRISPVEYDLGDYVLYFTGVALAREGRIDEAAATFDRLVDLFPKSALAPYLAHELAFAAAEAGDVPSAAKYGEMSRGRVNGNGRKAAEGYIAARLLEAEAANQDEKAVWKKAAEAHLENFTSYTVQEGAVLSMDRIREWREKGMLSDWHLPITFYGRYAKGLSRAGEDTLARAVFREALESFPALDNSYDVLLDYAEFLRKQGETSAARSLLARAAPDAPPAFRSEVDFLFARVEWKAGRTSEARRMFLAIAQSDANPSIAERSRYQAAWISEEEGDLESAVEQFGKLAGARDESTRQESMFRHAFNLYRLRRYGEAIATFEEGARKASSPVERARHAYWRARALEDFGKKEEGTAALRVLAASHDAGPFALFSILRLGGNPFEMLRTPAVGGTRHCEEEKDTLWEAIRKAPWTKEEAEKVRRAERLTSLGLVEYAILEAERVDRAAIRKATGLADGGTPGLFRYLAGDLPGAIRDTVGIPADPSAVGLIDRLQYPLAPQYLGDCDERKSGVDPLLLHAIIRQESFFQYNALSQAGAVGLMQLMPRTAAEVARKERMRKPVRRNDLLKPELNIALGAAYFAGLLRGYDGDYVRAVAAYNAGEAAVSRWWKQSDGDPAMFLERVSYRETRSYLRKIFFNLLQYYRIYRPGLLARHVPSPPTGDVPVPDASATPPAGAMPGGAEENVLPGGGSPGDGKSEG